jgi:phosphoserine phosphatase RsbU/P
LRFGIGTGDAAALRFLICNDVPESASLRSPCRLVSISYQTGDHLRGDDNLERPGATCTVVGLFEKWDCAIEERQLAPSDAVLLYTDGVTEALNDEGEEFGEERLLEAARQHRELSPPELLAAVADHARRFSPHERGDDITLIVAKCI